MISHIFKQALGCAAVLAALAAPAHAVVVTVTFMDEPLLIEGAYLGAGFMETGNAELVLPPGLLSALEAVGAALSQDAQPAVMAVSGSVDSDTWRFSTNRIRWSDGVLRLSQEGQHRLAIRDFSYDPQTPFIRARLRDSSGVYQSDVPFFTYGSQSGQLAYVLKDGDQTIDVAFHELALTLEGANALGKALGLSEDQVSGLLALEPGGGLATRYFLTNSIPVAGVPETGTWLLMGLGLVAVGFVSRARRTTGCC